MEVDLVTRELLDNEIEYDDIILWCLQDGIITEKVAREKLKLNDDEKLPKINKRTDVDLECHGWYEEELLNGMCEDTIIDYLKEEGHCIDPVEKDLDSIIPIDKAEWIKFMRNFYHKKFGNVWTKQDFKKEICQLIDDTFTI